MKEGWESEAGSSSAPQGKVRAGKTPPSRHPDSVLLRGPRATRGLAIGAPSSIAPGQTRHPKDAWLSRLASTTMMPLDTAACSNATDALNQTGLLWFEPDFQLEYEAGRGQSPVGASPGFNGCDPQDMQASHGDVLPAIGIDPALLTREQHEPGYFKGREIRASTGPDADQSSSEDELAANVALLPSSGACTICPPGDDAASVALASYELEANTGPPGMQLR